MIPLQVSGPTDYAEVVLGVSAVIFIILGLNIRRSRRGATNETEYGNWYVYLIETGDYFEGILTGAERYMKRKWDSPVLKAFLEEKCAPEERAELDKLKGLRFYAQTGSPHNTLIMSPDDMVKESVITAREWHWLPFPHYETYHRFFADLGSRDLGIVNGWRSLLVFSRKPGEKAIIPELPNPDLLAKAVLVLSTAATSREEVAAARESERHWREGFEDEANTAAGLAATVTKLKGILSAHGIDATGVPDLTMAAASLMEVIGVTIVGVMIGLAIFPGLLQRGQLMTSNDYMLDALLGAGLGVLFLKWRQKL